MFKLAVSFLYRMNIKTAALTNAYTNFNMQHENKLFFINLHNF